jgi:ferrous iron transport protein B
MEMPLYHVPNLRTIGLYALTKVWAFLKRAATVIVVVSVIVWVLVSFPGGDVEHSYLARVGRSLEPVGALAGMDWRLIVATLSAFVAKENSLAALGVIYGTEGQSLGQVLMVAVTPAAALGFLVVNMLFLPCVATVAAIRQETGSWGWTAAGSGLMLVAALSAGVLVFQAARIAGLG